jgi:hypothetical protein
MASMACLAIAVLGAGCSDGPEVRAAAAPVGWTTYRDTNHVFEVQFPSDWRRARRSLTPNLADPRELVSLGTGALRTPGPDDCAHMPQGALNAMSPRDVLVSIQESRRPFQGDSKRPADLRLDRSTRAPGLGCTGSGRQDVWWLTFQDRGRAFYALVALGREAAPARRLQAQRVLRSLRFDAVEGREGG